MTSGSDAINGRYYDGRVAVGTDVHVALTDGQLVATPPLFAVVPIAATRIPSRIGDTPRAIRLPDGGIVETDDHATIDHWQATHGLGKNRAHRLESSAASSLAALVLLIAAFAAATIWGIPYMARLVAERLPDDVAADAGRSALQQLDRIVFAESGLNRVDRTKLHMLFAAIRPEGAAVHYQLEFRHGGRLGANAFALPDGTIVLTDELVELAASSDELAAVMLHEIGHVEGRHSLRLMLSHAGLAALTFAVFGDVSAAGSLVVLLPNALMESAYSRDMEWDADTFAHDHMTRLGIPKQAFANLLVRLPASDARFLSSHPPSPWRIARFTEQ